MHFRKVSYTSQVWSERWRWRYSFKIEVATDAAEFTNVIIARFGQRRYLVRESQVSSNVKRGLSAEWQAMNEQIIFCLVAVVA